MYLKQIKVVGFKSFVDKINIDLEKGITGVVGPNGSGKSNIIDAVRWVLGEQSIKSLRGDGSMTDVIFSGSKTRNPASSASVTLIFDNSDRYFPLDYTEVSIKRTVFKTGENEYYINGEKCRLKDITNLVIDTGLAKESFNIIGQGNINEILSNRPEDRRIIFEEAARVLKYKKRKEEAIRKLDRTHDNIDRINDIIRELEGQVGPLKEQAEKARVYLDAKKDLEDIEIALLVHDIENMNDDYQNAKEKIDTINEEILLLNENYNSSQASLEKEKVKQTKDNELLYKLQQQLIEATSKTEKLHGEKNLVTERKKYDSKDIKLHENVLELKEKQLKISNDIISAKDDVNLKKKYLSDLNSNIEEINTKINDLKNKRNLLSDKNDKNLRVKTEIEHKIRLLEHSIENNNMYSYATKAVLNNPKLKGIHNAIGELINVPDQYVTAINVALGASSQFIVVDNEAKAKEAINYLKNNNLGRATFFPLNVIKARKVDIDTYQSIKKHSAFIDVASNLIGYEEKYHDIILNQLGSVIIANNIDGANEIGKLINYRYKIVTLDGELLHVGGSITGGNQKKVTGVINDKYELKKLNNELKLLITEESELKLKLNDVDVLLKEYELKNYNYNLERGSIVQIIENKNKIIEEYQFKLDNVDGELKGLDGVLNSALDEEEKHIVDEYYSSIKEKERINKLVLELSNKVNIIKETIDEKEEDIKRLNVSLNKKQQELKDLEIRVNRLDVKLDNLLNYLNEEWSITFDKAKKEYILYTEENEARKKVEKLKSQIKNLGIVNLGAIEEYEKINTRYEFLIGQKNDLFKAENTLLEIIKEMDLLMKELFAETFNQIKAEFKTTFKELFGGGNAELTLTDPNNLLETGIEINALPPGKKLQHISLLSGGEKTLTAIALLFAVLKVRPVPFCLLDEVEAALDEVNVLGFVKCLKSLKDKTQFVIITHKKKTMEYVDVLYGITMQESGVSKLVSVKLEEILK